MEWTHHRKGTEADLVSQKTKVRMSKRMLQKKTSSTVIFISSATEDSEGPEMEARRQEEWLFN